MSFVAIELVRDNLINYVFGSELIFALAIVFVLMVFLLSARVNPLWAFTIIVPLFVSLVGAGYFGADIWVKSAVMVVLASVWAFVLWRLMGE